MKIKTWLIAVGLAVALSANVYASDIFQGKRGPTNFQADERIYNSIAEKDGKKTQKTTSTTILKYWNGDKDGCWGFLSLPYSLGTNAQGLSKQSCLGDISLGLGPRGRIDNFYWCAYAGATLPTGELGNKRTDFNLGAFVTQMSSDQKWDFDGSLEYKITGVNNKGINPANELAVGL